jgi:ParB family chromosome partitioning protein
VVKKKTGLGKGLGALIPQLIPDASKSTKGQQDSVKAESAMKQKGAAKGDIVKGGAAKVGGTAKKANPKKYENSAKNVFNSDFDLKVERGAASKTHTSSKRPVDMLFDGASNESSPSAAGAGAGAGNVGVGAGEGVNKYGAYFTNIDITSIKTNSKQPRTIFDEEEIEGLSNAIKEVGVLQPIIVRPAELAKKGYGKKVKGKQADATEASAEYELIMGERRLRASKLAGLTQIPAIVRNTTDDNMLRDALLENMHRVDLNPLEEAAAYSQLMSDFGITQEELSKRIAKSRSQVANTLRLLKLPASVQKMLATSVISAGHARALLTLEIPQEMEKLADKIIREGLSVRSVEEIVSLNKNHIETKGRKSKKDNAKIAPTELTEFSEKIADSLDTDVEISLGAKGGKIIVKFADLHDLQRIVKVLDNSKDVF